ncbi:hypothetical protein STENM223S_11199 [Streptomyces tendae]
MQGDPEVIEFLNEQLTAELTAINQYFLHAKLQDHKGWTKLAKYTRAESFDEMRHAEVLTDRILLLDGLPNYQRLFHVRVGQSGDRDVPGRPGDRARGDRPAAPGHRGDAQPRTTSRRPTSSRRSSPTRSTTSTTWTPSST